MLCRAGVCDRSTAHMGSSTPMSTPPSSGLDCRIHIDARGDASRQRRQIGGQQGGAGGRALADERAVRGGRGLLAPLVVKAHPAVADRGVGPAGQLGGDAAPLPAVEAVGLLNERVLLGAPLGAAVLGAADAARRPRLSQSAVLRAEAAAAGRAGRGGLGGQKRIHRHSLRCLALIQSLSELLVALKPLEAVAHRVRRALLSARGRWHLRSDERELRPVPPHARQQREVLLDRPARRGVPAAHALGLAAVQRAATHPPLAARRA
mmetsp:Transcript_1917/g.6305  ORF Transcript_1917/g.6305 Transcript_1917/m.6305 type:complete len:264 (-) Transcript_1917:488-1279(-)